MKHPLLRSFVTILSTILAFAIIYSIFTPDATRDWIGIDPEDDVGFANKMKHRSYFSLMIQSTIGLGDIQPKSGRARLIFSAQALTIMLELTALIVNIIR